MKSSDDRWLALLKNKVLSASRYLDCIHFFVSQHLRRIERIMNSHASSCMHQLSRWESEFWSQSQIEEKEKDCSTVSYFFLSTIIKMTFRRRKCVSFAMLAYSEWAESEERDRMIFKIEVSATRINDLSDKLHCFQISSSLILNLWESAFARIWRVWWWYLLKNTISISNCSRFFDNIMQ